MPKKILINLIFISLFFLLLVNFVHAHVVVKPNEVGIGSFQTFVMGVPNEKNIPVVKLRLIFPPGLNFVSPNVKPGWTMNIKKEGSGENAKVKEIEWVGGSIPEGQRDDFYFSAQVPVKETTLTWKAYQTYSDGNVVTWDQDSKNLSDQDQEKMEKEGKGPASRTEVVDDLKIKKQSDEQVVKLNNTLILASTTLGISLLSLLLHFRKRGS